MHSEGAVARSCACPVHTLPATAAALFPETAAPTATLHNDMSVPTSATRESRPECGIQPSRATRRGRTRRSAVSCRPTQSECCRQSELCCQLGWRLLWPVWQGAPRPEGHASGRGFCMGPLAYTRRMATAGSPTRSRSLCPASCRSEVVDTRWVSTWLRRSSSPTPAREAVAPAVLHLQQTAHERLGDTFQHPDEDRASLRVGRRVAARVVLLLQDVTLGPIDLREDPLEELFRRQLPRLLCGRLVGVHQQLRPVLHGHLDLRGASPRVGSSRGRRRLHHRRGGGAGFGLACHIGDSLLGVAVHPVQVVEQHQRRVLRVAKLVELPVVHLALFEERGPRVDKLVGHERHGVLDGCSLLALLELHEGDHDEVIAHRSHLFGDLI
mmetsp:Transcript_7842/g.17538  ORF Transcript_7842/g.17538 Transcript_7842/m.17538 type:complete len:383 (-) Transcript_7842:398-1546(-)